MKVVFRVDASFQIGTGHVMRCLTLAEELKKLGHEVIFISRKLKGHLCDLIRQLGYEVYCLPYQNKTRNHCDTKHAQWLETSWEIDAQQTTEIIDTHIKRIDWLIVDHYALDRKWESQLKKYSRGMMVIDDLADREHLCDILLDQNYYLNFRNRYKYLVPLDCKLLLGPKYALLRDEFIELRKELRHKEDNNIRNVMVFFGGSDPTNETLRTLYALNELEYREVNIDVVVGVSNPRKDEIKRYCHRFSHVTFHCGVNYMARLMQQADVAICAGGTITWERYCMGLPAILISVAYNQIEICQALTELGIDYYLGTSETVDRSDIINAFYKFQRGDISLQISSTKALEMVDGLGKYRVVNELLKC
ncbi:UDP-2,4-diacetamido-2,4,6-trideoxy-beta-L-altropyranose hydrolase [Anoxybacillus ayderensis]|uniref:UDP-2,4-diacetamido-2,4, 6-trideoxy-beta-L-altropyranose hydrolase n=1 Tax=Anoxybacillus gonensis TaxID=198467 RepID=UPI0002ED3C98|nr:UDP-2,4-diacetamido-2,4,6-trideoxy-beta-L-altropyranose hydrolase [Anoxybacillus ayderensis G10]MCX8047583.1 UDP-2,4-diacetamido-2,4,6-trideoxy-beta-L-altropyranose hydrolase [Anoxybacillus gonensis]THD17775.1 UDP-2,4-diacetamido-2,4,6-trideoxy-beta-L-altropyranose hydrolase [Anoxybacillus ayderensis]